MIALEEQTQEDLLEGEHMNNETAKRIGYGITIETLMTDFRGYRFFAEPNALIFKVKGNLSVEHVRISETSNDRYQVELFRKKSQDKPTESEVIKDLKIDEIRGHVIEKLENDGWK